MARFKKGPETAGPGRPKGLQNKATLEFKATVTRVLEDNRDNIARWLKTVAEGNSEAVNAHALDGKIVKEIPADPAKALDLVSKLAEYAYPKLARTETTGPDGGPQELVIKWSEK